ncbi:hypothetical protein WJX73_007532 [Symbiochloris irregularis]|uniref:Uncharacterized protein n=1 Tax=Symbiochloris irregularis TaxID=706552 RepID=A0AAW1PNI5_9CHLO
MGAPSKGKSPPCRRHLSEEETAAAELASRWSGADSNWSTATGGNLQPCTGSAASKRSFEAEEGEDETQKRVKDEEDGATCKERLSTHWLLSTSPGAASGRDFGGLGSYPLTADLAGLASCESSSSYAEFHCDASSLLGDQLASQAKHLQHVPQQTRATAAQPVCRRALQLPGETSGHSPEESTTPQSSSWPLIEVVEIIRNLSESELQLQISPHYLRHHDQTILPDLFLDSCMRKTALSWLVEVACEYHFHQDTLFLAASLLDRFLSCTKGVPRSSLQLVGVACMLIAAKHEEERYPSVSEFTSIADNCFSQHDLIMMESMVLSSLGFRVSMPTAFTFLSLYHQGVGMSDKTQALSTYLAELSILGYHLLCYLPSTIAAASALLALAWEQNPVDAASLCAISGYSAHTLQGCVGSLLMLHHTAYEAQDISDPFMPIKDKYCEASRKVAPFSLVKS